MKTLRKISSVSLSMLASAILTAIAISIILCGVGLTALYLVRYVDMDTPEIRSLKCAIGITHPDCPQYGADMNALRDELQSLHAQKAATEQQLAELQGAKSKLENLRRIEDAIDSVTLFKKHRDTASGLRITVGTVYTRLVEPNLSPEWFCYISLPNGAFQEDRNLHFRNRSGFKNFDPDTLRQAGVSADTMRYAESVCQPYLIGGVE